MSIQKALLALIAIFLADKIYVDIRSSHGLTIGDAIAVLALCASHAFQTYLNNKAEATIPEELKKDLETMKSTVASLKVGSVLTKRQ